MGIHAIHLGMTNAWIARVNKCGLPEAIMDPDNGMSRVPMAVFIGAQGEVIVGQQAVEAGNLVPERLIRNFLYMQDRSAHGMLAMMNGRTYTLETVCSYMVEQLLCIARGAGEDVKKIVLVTAAFDMKARDVLISVVKKMGLELVAAVNEITATAWYLPDALYEAGKTVLVYDLGGTVFQTALILLNMKDGCKEAKVISCKVDSFLGGASWDGRLYELITEKYSEKTGLFLEDAEDDSLADLHGRLEGLKERLSMKDRVRVKVADEYGGTHLEVTREEFENACEQLQQETILCVDQMLNNAGYSDDRIDAVLAVGGGARMPMIERMLKDRFGDKWMASGYECSAVEGAVLYGMAFRMNRVG